MDDKSNISGSNPPEKEIRADECMKSSDIKQEPKEYEYHDLNEQHTDDKQDFQVIKFAVLKCIKVEKKDVEDTDGFLESENVHQVSEIEESTDISDIVDSCDGETKHNDVENQEYVGISNIKAEETDESDETDDTRDYTFTGNQIEGSFSCNNCNQAFTTAAYCYKHTRRCRSRVYDHPSTQSDNASVHDKKLKLTNDQDGLYQCDLCDNTFKSRKGLYEHTRRHSGVGLHTCSECNKQFPSPSDLARHILIHTKEKPHKCTQCEAAFNQSSDIKIHMLTHSGVRPHKCVYCGKSFTQLSNLTRHRRTHTSEKPYQCTVCSRAFGHSNSVKRHMKIHFRGTGNKPS